MVIVQYVRDGESTEWAHWSHSVQPSPPDYAGPDDPETCCRATSCAQCHGGRYSSVDSPTLRHYYEDGHLREMQSFKSGLTARADPVSRQSTGTKGKGLEKFSIRTPEPISESDSEVDAAIVSAAVYGYGILWIFWPWVGLPSLCSCSGQTDLTDSRSAQLDVYSGPGGFPGDAVPEPRDFVAFGMLCAGLRRAPVIPWHPPTRQVVRRYPVSENHDDLVDFPERAKRGTEGRPEAWDLGCNLPPYPGHSLNGEVEESDQGLHQSSDIQTSCLWTPSFADFNQSTDFKPPVS